MFRHLGDSFFSDYIDSTYKLTADFYNIIAGSVDFEAVTIPDSNILCFRYTGNPEEELNELNRKIRERIIKAGNFYIVQAELNGKIWLRLTIINPLTTLETLKSLLDEVRLRAREV